MDMLEYKAIMDGRKKLIDALNNGERSWERIAAVGVVYKDKTILSTNQACHYGLRDMKAGSIAVVSGLMKPIEVMDEDEALVFLDWLLNRSPYSSTFITKSAHEALHYKMIISSSHTPSNLMAAGLVASRRLWEYVTVARVFVDLVKAGVNEDLAFYLGHLARVSFDRTGNCDWGGNKDGHCSLNSGAFGKEAMVNWLNHKPMRLNSNYSALTNYHGYAGMYGSDRGLDNWIHKNFPYKKGGAKATNPFPIDTDKVAGCDYTTFIQGMVEFQHNIFEYIGWQQPAKKEAA